MAQWTSKSASSSNFVPDRFILRSVRSKNGKKQGSRRGQGMGHGRGQGVRFDRFDILFDSIYIASEGRGGPPW